MDARRTGLPPGARAAVAALLALVIALALGACGSDDGGGGSGDGETEASGSSSGGVQQEPEAAADPSASDFPQPEGRTLEELADLARPGINIGPATSHYVTGENRFAFGLIDSNNRFIYAPSAVYIGRTPQDTARGPFPAPTDSLITEERYRSEQAATESDAPIESIYSNRLELPQPGAYAVLVLTQTGDELFGATSQINVVPDDSIPAPGEPPPRIETDTLEDSGGQIELIDTRVPPSGLQEAQFGDVIGERPVALLFATPQLCQSRVCGPVTDIAVQLEDEYGDRMEFIHQEVFVDNEVEQGFREPLRAFNLRTEPWLFTFDAEGRIAARLEGSFGLDEFERAVEAAL